MRKFSFITPAFLFIFACQTSTTPLTKTDGTGSSVGAAVTVTSAVPSASSSETPVPSAVPVTDASVSVVGAAGTTGAQGAGGSVSTKKLDKIINIKAQFQKNCAFFMQK